MDGIPIRVLRYDDDYVKSQPDFDKFILDKSKYGTCMWLSK